jgi:hypothetical protein
LRREQEDDDRSEADGRRAARPGGDDPEQRDSADRHERTPGIDESEQPIGHAKTPCAVARDRMRRIGDEQG